MTVIAIGQAGEFSSPSIASTPEGDIRWHVYVRRETTGASDFGIYAQREVDVPGPGALGTFEPEVRIISGERARVVFLGGRWQLAYVWNGNAFVLQFERDEAPSIVPPPVGEDLVDYFEVQRGDPPARPDGRQTPRHSLLSVNVLSPAWAGAAQRAGSLPQIRADDVLFETSPDATEYILYRNIGQRLTEVSRVTVDPVGGGLRAFPYSVGEDEAEWQVAPVRRFRTSGRQPDFRGPVTTSRGLVQGGALRLRGGNTSVRSTRTFFGAAVILVVDSFQLDGGGGTQVSAVKEQFLPVALVGNNSELQLDGAGASRVDIQLTGFGRIVV